MDDIVTRLRSEKLCQELAREAAEEIVRLRFEVKEKDREISLLYYSRVE